MSSKTKKGRSSPLEIVLEFARAEDAGDPFAFRFAEQAYLMRQEGGAVESATFPWGPEVLEELSLVQRARPDREAAQRLGDRLRAFLAEGAWKADEARLVEAIEAKRRVIVTVRSAAAELYALPWELVALPATGQHLGELPGCLLRYEWPNTRTAAPDPDPPPEGGRVLFAWSAAGGAVPADAHLEALRRACLEGQLPFDEAADVLPSASLATLQKALAAAPVAVLHLLCHGGAKASATPSFGLVLDGPDGRGTEIADAGALRQALAPHAGSLRLVVLAACHGGDPGALGSHLGSLAQALHRVGIPAVVASRFPLSVPGSIALTEVLYAELLGRLASLESAFLAARARLAERASSLDWASIQLYARAEGRVEHRPFVFRPYRGLLPFNEEDRRFYFGREHDVERLLELLRDGRQLITLVGASGSGKSSMVMAGLVPALREGALGAWEVVLLRPGASPCRSLAEAITTLAGTPGEGVDELAAAFGRRTETLVEVVEKIFAGRPGNAQLLVVVDQFEEVFLPPPDRPAGGSFVDNPDVTAFLDNLLYATAKTEDRVRAVLTLRADFVGQCLDHRALAEQIRASMDIALPMDEAELRAAILRPAALAGLRFDEGLVDALIDGLRDGAGAESRKHGVTFVGGKASLAAGKLPLLQFALAELWENRKGDQVTWHAWRAIGGVRGAVAKRAEQIYAECASDEERALVRELFGRLVQIGKGIADTRKRARRAELEAVAPGRVGPALDRWIQARLLTVSGGEISVAHEALIREWGTLRRWIDEDREAIAVRQDVGRDAEQWGASGGGDDELWRGGRLARALDLRKTGRLSLAASEVAFLEAAAEASKREQEAVAARRLEERDHDLRVSSGARSAARIAFGVVVTAGCIAVPRLSAPTHLAAAAVLAGADALLLAALLGERRSLLGTRVDRRLWASLLVQIAAMAVLHGALARLGAAVAAGVTADLVISAAFAALEGVAFHAPMALTAPIFLVAAITAAAAPARAFDAAAAATLGSNLLIAYVWRTMRTRAGPPPSTRL